MHSGLARSGRAAGGSTGNYTTKDKEEEGHGKIRCRAANTPGTCTWTEYITTDSRKKTKTWLSLVLGLSSSTDGRYTIVNIAQFTRRSKHTFLDVDFVLEGASARQGEFWPPNVSTTKWDTSPYRVSIKRGGNIRKMYLTENKNSIVQEH